MNNFEKNVICFLWGILLIACLAVWITPPKCKENVIASINNNGSLTCIYENPKWGVATTKEEGND